MTLSDLDRNVHRLRVHQMMLSAFVALPGRFPVAVRPSAHLGLEEHRITPLGPPDSTLFRYESAVRRQSPRDTDLVVLSSLPRSSRVSVGRNICS